MNPTSGSKGTVTHIYDALGDKLEKRVHELPDSADEQQDKYTNTDYIEMKEIPKIFADFQNTDVAGRVRLNTNGTFRDIEANSLKLREGMELHLNDGELSAIGIIHFSAEENMRVAVINWDLG